MKLHLDAEGFSPKRGPVTQEEIEKYLPLALEQKPKIEKGKNKKGKRKTNKIYKVEVNGITYTLVTHSKDDFRSFYSNKKAANAVTDTNMSSATGMLHSSNLPSSAENASGGTGKTSEKINGEGQIGTDGYGDDNSRFSIPPEMDAEFLAAEEAYRQTAMTMEERLNSLLSETEDVAEKDKIYLNGLVRGGSAFAIDGKYFRNWQEVLEQFKKDLEGLELNQEQQDIYDVVFQQKDKIRLRINDLNELEDVFVNFGSRKKGIKKFISVHYAGLRNPVTALEVLNIGDVIRRGKITE